MPRPSFVAALFVAALPLAACEDKATLDRSRVEVVTVDGRKFEVRTAAIGPDEYRMLVVRATVVVNADAEREAQRNWNVARQSMDRTCKGRSYTVVEDRLEDEVNLFVRFKCPAA